MTDPIRMNVDRAREVLASPELPWEPAVKQALAQAFIDLTFANDSNEEALKWADKENATLRAQLADRDRQIEDFIEWLKNHDPSQVVREMADRKRAEIAR